METKEFDELIKKHLPKYIEVSDKKYALDAILYSGGDRFRIYYYESNGEPINFGDKWNYLFDFTYQIVDKLPEPKEYKEGDLYDACIYTLEDHKNIIINDFIPRTLLKTFYTVLDEIPSKRELQFRKEQEFQRELTLLLNKYSKENGSNTPNFVLAEYLINCLNTYNTSVKYREKWYGREINNDNKELLEIKE